MNATSRAILQTVLATDTSLSGGERGAVQRVINGETETLVGAVGGPGEPLLVTQKAAADLLSVSRVRLVSFSDRMVCETKAMFSTA